MSHEQGRHYLSQGGILKKYNDELLIANIPATTQNGWTD